MLSKRRGLLTLPAELRNRIWEIVLDDERYSKRLIEVAYKVYGDGPGPRIPSLTHVCSQLRNETIGMWYGCRCFTQQDISSATDYATCVAWPEGLGDKAATSIREVSISASFRQDCVDEQHLCPPEEIAHLVIDFYAQTEAGLVTLSWYYDSPYASTKRAVESMLAIVKEQLRDAEVGREKGLGREAWLRLLSALRGIATEHEKEPSDGH